MTPHGTTRWADQITGKLDVIPTTAPPPSTTTKKTTSVPKIDLSTKKPANQLSIKDFFTSGSSAPSLLDTNKTKPTTNNKAKSDNNKNGCLL